MYLCARVCGHYRGAFMSAHNYVRVVVQTGACRFENKSIYTQVRVCVVVFTYDEIVFGANLNGTPPRQNKH